MPSGTRPFPCTARETAGRLAAPPRASGGREAPDGIAALATQPGTVGYADRSASCVSPPYALLPFLAPKRTAEGAKAISPDIWPEKAVKKRQDSALDFSRFVKVVKTGRGGRWAAGEPRQIFTDVRHEVTTP